MDSDLKNLNDLFFHEHAGNAYRLLHESWERPLLERVLRMTGGNQVKASRILGINRNTLRTKLKRFGLR